ncbi:DUF3971 domain-containing protein [Alsobacter sp. SYSU M60028]|uniref:DUF3971 domain-containing protein n=1 Tax=Alsobacter ponti TaxID=2962936 RepID=A0ABT1LFK7_9HYPH|nr:DUF3971 domain-containing protein [Alsobacter ponti]MCP8940282.1 DUF3971 domain-containing protein [Alsobacter ponti]
MAWRLSLGPLAFDSMAERVAQALEAQFGDGYDVDVRHAEIDWTSGGPVLGVTGVTVRDMAGNLVVAAPQAEIGFSSLALATGNLVPRNISFVGLAVTLTVAPDGAVSISASGDEPAPPHGGPATQPTDTSFGPGAVLAAIASHSGPMAVLEQAGIRDGRLRINDRRRNRNVTYDRMSLAFEKVAGSQVAARLAAQGSSGAWGLSATIDDAAAEGRSVTVETRNLPLSDLLGIAQPGALPVYTDMPVSGSLRLRLDGAGAVSDLEARVDGGAAVVLIDDPDARPVFVDRLSADLGWNAADQALAVRSLAMKAGETRVSLTGSVSPPRAAGETWRLALSGSNATLAGETPQDPTVRIDTISLTGRMPIGLGGLLIDRFEVAGPDLGIAGSFAVGRADDFEGLRLDMTARPMPARAALAFWPAFIAADARKYLQDAVLGGRIERFELVNSFTPQTLADAIAHRPIPESAVRIDVAVSGGSLRPAPGLPVLTGISATSLTTGHAVRVDIPRANGPAFGARPLVFSNGVYAIDDLAAKPPLARVEFDVSGGFDATVDALRAEPLKPFVGLRLDPAAVKGTVDSHVRIGLPLKPGLTPQDVAVQIAGSATGVSADLPGRDRVENGAFTFTQDAAGLAIKGEGRLSGAPATFDLRQPRGTAAADLTVAMTMDEAARARRGIKLGAQLAGPVDIKVAVHDAFGAKPATRVEADLAKATVNDLIPGWDKPAGKPGKASFRLEGDADTLSLEDLVLDAAGGVSARGSVRLGADGSLLGAHLTGLRLTPGEDIRVDLDRQGGVLKAVLRAGMADARPVLRSLMSPRPSSLPALGDLDLDLKAQTIVGENGEKLSGAEMRLVLKSGEFRDFRLSGRFDNAPVSGQMARTEGNLPGIVVESGDAGSFLRFADIYKRMLGGTLLLQLTGSTQQLAGTLSANNFHLSNEPALARVAGQGNGDQRPVNVAFSKLRAGFVAEKGRLDLRESTMFGPSVGGTLEGMLDFTKDRVDLSGTFVPAYGLNNIVSQVPLVGPILGGGKNEGLFGVNFRITGRVTQPVLSINPLSAVAPGFLRKFFGVIGPGEVSATGAATNPAAPTGSANLPSAIR